MRINKSLFPRPLLTLPTLAIIAGCHSMYRETTEADRSPARSAELYSSALDLAADAGPAGRASVNEAFAKACSAGQSAACLRLQQTPEKIDEAPNKLSVLQGATGSDTTQISILSPEADIGWITLWNGRELIANIPDPKPVPLAIDRLGRNGAANYKVRFMYLKPGIKYRLEIADRAGRALDFRYLRTLEVSKSGIPVRVALLSCMNDKFGHLQAGMPIWLDLKKQVEGGGGPAARPLDIVFFLGDNVYPDVDEPMPKPASVARRYEETRFSFPIYRFRQLVPVLATWDDHDYGVNNGGADYPDKEHSRKIFEHYFAQDVIPGVLERATHGGKTLGVAFEFRAFGQNFLFMDGRSFRVAGAAAGAPSQWGLGQEQWLQAQLQGEQGAGRPAWIINGSQYFGAYHQGESYERDMPANFATYFLPLLRAKASPPAVLVSGDIHMSEINDLKMDLSYQSYELTSSGVHSYDHLGDSPPLKNPRRLRNFAETGYNYMIVESKVVGGGLDLNVRVRGMGKPDVLNTNLQVRKVLQSSSN